MAVNNSSLPAFLQYFYNFSCSLLLYENLMKFRVVGNNKGMKVYL